jgi:hypothetical protein
MGLFLPYREFKGARKGSRAFGNSLFKQLHPAAQVPRAGFLRQCFRPRPTGRSGPFRGPRLPAFSVPAPRRRTWQGQRDSNPRPTVLETVALPAELYPFNAAQILCGKRGCKPGDYDQKPNPPVAEPQRDYPLVHIRGSRPSPVRSHRYRMLSADRRKYDRDCGNRRTSHPAPGSRVPPCSHILRRRAVPGIPPLQHQIDQQSEMRMRPGTANG